MNKFWLEFSYPWLLLLIVPALLLVLIPHFRLAKKYRRTRNRITTIVLELIVMILSVSVLAGMTFHVRTPNKKNEIIVLVDVSDTEEQSARERDDFVEKILQASRFDKFTVGVVTFGFTQKFAVPFTDNAGKAFDAYMAAEKPDTSATDIASALTYAADRFSEGSNGKIILVTDGKETDESALSVLKSVTAKGIRVDAVNVPSQFGGPDVRITDVELPDYHLSVGDEFSVNVTLVSTTETECVVQMADNGVVDSTTGTAEARLTEGEKIITFNHVFSGEEPLHELKFTVTANGDSVEQNNVYTTYYFIESFDKVLVLQRADGQSDALKELLEEGKYTVTVANVYDENGVNLPKSVDDLRQYDEVILNNISNADLTNVNMPEGFDTMLYTYVNVYGGGLFTCGGTESGSSGIDETANAYNRLDMSGTLYQSMLPVQAIDYTPPVAVMVIIDRSGSMSATGDSGKSYLDWAKEGAGECLNALTERDYFGLMALDNDSEYILKLTSLTQRDVILDAIQNKIGDATGGTVFVGAIRSAIRALKAQTNVDKRHIIIVTDGAVPDNQIEFCEEDLRSAQESDGITLSIVGIGLSESPSSSDYVKMQRLIDAASTRDENGEIISRRNPLVYNSSTLSNLPSDMREELNIPEIKEVNDNPFYLTVKDEMSNLVAGLPRRKDSLDRDTNQIDTEKLGGFFGVKVRSAADLIVCGDYDVPIYAQWKYGEGMVGSFMCDLQATEWSEAFMQSPAARTLLLNIFSNLLPTRNIRPNEMNVELSEDNYGNKLSIFSMLAEGETIEGTVTDMSAETPAPISLNAVGEPTGNLYVTIALSSENSYSRAKFIAKKAGVYRIELVKKDAEGNVLASYTTFKAFAYSEEYDLAAQSVEFNVKAEFFDPLQERGNGMYIDNADDVFNLFEGFDKTVEKVFDPRFLFMILAIVLFVTEIAVRKFKFKWPHEIIRKMRSK